MKEIFKKIINIIKDKKLYLITAAISTIIVVVLYISSKVTPFGGKSLLCVDFYHQYGPMLGELYDRVREGKNLTYSFTMSMGLPFFRNFMNYMSSPFNAIIFLFPKSGLLTSFSVIIGLKPIIASCTFVYFISHKFKSKSLAIAPLGILYAFSAYYAAYYWNIMWLDGMVFVPLITLGIEYIVKEGKWKFYTIFLSLMLFSNYFIGYMICIFSVLYFIVFSIHEFYIKKGETKKNMIKFFKGCLLFGLGSITAGLLVAALYIPLYYSLKSISATGGTFPTTQYYLFHIEDFLKYHFTGVTTTTFASDPITAPNISTGVLSIGLLFLFLFNLDIPHKTKIAYLFLLGFFIVAFFNPQLDYILQAFHVPNDLPYRYSFLYIFIMMIIGAYAVLNIQKMKYPFVAITYVFMMILIFIISKDEWEGITKYMLYANMIMISLYFIFYSGHRFIKDMKTAFLVAIIIASAIDCVTSIAYNWDITQVMSTFYEDYDKTEELLQYVRNYDNSPFYRIENTQMMTLNDPSWYGYNGITTFSSMEYESMAKLQHHLGLASNTINSYQYSQTTPVYDMMFDVKYFIGNTNDDIRYTPIKTIDETANEFKYNVGLGFASMMSFDSWSHESTDPFLIQNQFMTFASGSSDIFVKMEPVVVTELFNDDGEYIVRYGFNNPGDNMYFYTNDYTVDFFVIGECVYDKNNNYMYYGEQEGLHYSVADTYREPRIINIKSQDDIVYVDIAYNTSYIYGNTFYMYSINQEMLKNAYESLNENKMTVTEFSEKYIKASISTNRTYMYTSIPYDDGWNVYINGDKVKTYKIADALLGFDIPTGNSEIVFEYKPVGKNLGLLGTALGIFILVADKIFRLIKKLFKKTKTKNKKAIKK